MQTKSLLLALGISVALTSPAVAQQAQDTVQQFEGTFRSTMTMKQDRSEMNERIDDLVDQMNFIKRPFARGRLKEATKPCSELHFETEGNNLDARCDDRPKALAPITGEEGSYTNEEGHKYVLVYKVGDRQILQAFADQDGMRKNLYTLSPDGNTIKMETSIESDQLPEPLQFERTYERVP